jgi:hypothetical protein
LSFEEPPGEAEVFVLDDALGELLAVPAEPPQAEAAASMKVTKKTSGNRRQDFTVRQV